jgi:transposase-like protein
MSGETSIACLTLPCSRALPRMDETSVSIRGTPHYLYRTVDQDGKSVGSMLFSERTMESARTFLSKAVEKLGSAWPSKINLDGYTASHRAVRLLTPRTSGWVTQRPV